MSVPQCRRIDATFGQVGEIEESLLRFSYRRVEDRVRQGTAPAKCVTFDFVHLNLRNAAVMPSHPQAPYGGDRTLLSVSETARVLGVSTRTVIRELDAGRLTPVRIGRRTLLDPRDLDVYIEQRKVAAQ